MFKHLKHYKHHPRYRPHHLWISLLAIVIVIVLIVVLVFIRGCSRAEVKSQTEETIDAFDGVNIYTLDLEKIVEIGKPAIPFLAEMLQDEDQGVRWAAVMGLSAIGHQLDAKKDVLPLLKKALNDSDVSIRITAAELVMSFSDKDGIPVLIEALDSEEQLKPSEPPMPVKSQAAIVLIEYTDQDFQVDKEAWQNWWDQNKETLKWNKENGKFE